MVIISGPSTIGKNPLIYRACELYNLNFVTPCTTREIRQEEKNGNDYIFLLKEQFQSKIKSREITEWDYCLNNYYGYTFDFPGHKGLITHGLSRMTLRIKEKYPDKITTVFIMPKNKDMIFKNLRKIYTGNNLLLRETLVEEEICHSNLFDIVFKRSDSVFDLLNEKKMIDILLNEQI